MTAFIGVDLGTTAVKTIAISPEGEVIARAEQGYPLSTSRQGWSEQDPEDWWRATQATLSAALHGLRRLPARPSFRVCAVRLQRVRERSSVCRRQETWSTAKTRAFRRSFTFAIKSFTGGPWRKQMEDANTKDAVLSLFFSPCDVQPDRGRVKPQPSSKLSRPVRKRTGLFLARSK
jgi:FGGY family of carbohydrate kinases, N-terminal domain